jgi:MFS family permease
LTALGLSATSIGIILFGTLFGSALVTLWAGLVAHRVGRRRLLLGSCALMLATGIGFTYVRSFWPLFVIAFIGTLNPSAGDVSLFLPLEQAALAETVTTGDLTRVFAIYNVAGALAGALGALLSGLPTLVASRLDCSMTAAQRSGFVVYSAIAVIAAFVYRSLSVAVEVDPSPVHVGPLTKSRRIVLRLATLFSLDAFSGGFVIQSLLALWLFRRFNMSVEASGMFFFAAGLLGSLSQFASSCSGCPNRKNQDHGLYASAVERLPDSSRADAKCDADDSVPAFAIVAITDGRAGSAIVRDGDGAT